MTAMRVLHAGPVCTIQDAGRKGFLRFGVTPAGPMDWIAHATANLLAGNPPGAAAIEIGPGGMTVTAEGAALRLGLSAQGFHVRRDGSDLPTRVAQTLRPGAVLSIEPGPTHLWAYLSISGEMAEVPVMGSLATHLRSGLGPFGGRALRDGDRVAVQPARTAADDEERAIFDRAPPETGPIRFVPGPQDDLFAPGAMVTLASETYLVAPRSDRMAYRLSGPPLTHALGHDIVSDGVAFGSIQVPGDGLPLVLMADRQPTGGYPKIGTVICADLPRLAQMRVGQPLRFAPVSLDEAVTALRRAWPEPAALAELSRAIRRVPGLVPECAVSDRSALQPRLDAAAKTI